MAQISTGKKNFRHLTRSKEIALAATLLPRDHHAANMTLSLSLSLSLSVLCFHTIN